MQCSVLDPVTGQNQVPKLGSIDSHRQFYSVSPYKQSDRRKLSRDVCSPAENRDLVPSFQNIVTVRHIAGCLNSYPINRMVTSASGLQADLSHRPISHSSQPKSANVHLPNRHGKYTSSKLKCKFYKELITIYLAFPFFA